jgi:hypothetical protein
MEGPETLTFKDLCQIVVQTGFLLVLLLLLVIVPLPTRRSTLVCTSGIPAGISVCGVTLLALAPLFPFPRPM